MPIVTFSDAAAALGFRSRSALYRLRDQGQLADYMRPAARAGGAQRLELEPPGVPHLREHVRRLIRPQINNAGRSGHPDAVFWSEFGRFEPGSPSLPDGEFWDTVAAIMAGMLGIDRRDVAYQLSEAIAAVKAGARWDQARWDAATARGLLADLADDPGDAAILRAMGELLEAGTLPEAIAGTVRAAIAPLPVVVSD
jgi:hypothetical protein